MSAISTWSKTAASNNAAPPDGWPEGMAPSAVNNCARENMAAIRTQWENADWFDYGYTPTRTGATTFTLVGDFTDQYIDGRGIRVNDAATYYGAVVSSTYVAPDTTVTISLDSGSLTASLTAAALYILKSSQARLGGRSLKLYELPANGNAYVGFQAPDDVSTTAVWTLPSRDASLSGQAMFRSSPNILTWTPYAFPLADGTVGQALTTDGAQQASWTTLAATQAQMEAGSLTSVYTTPALQKFHPSSAKVWGTINGFGEASVIESYNMVGGTYISSGNYTIQFAPNFSSVNYQVSACCENTATTGVDMRAPLIRNGSQAIGSCGFYILNNAGSTFKNTNKLHFSAHGDL
jgi:hypothetical protein